MTPGSSYSLDQSKVFAGDFNRDGYTDLGLVTPRGREWFERSCRCCRNGDDSVLLSRWAFGS